MHTVFAVYSAVLPPSLVVIFSCLYGICLKSERGREIIETDGHLIWDKNYGREGIEEGEGDITE